MTEILKARVLFRPESSELRFLPEGPYPLEDSRFSWVAIQHGADSSRGSLNIFDMRSGANQSFALPGRPGFAFPCSDKRNFVIGCERRLALFDPFSNTCVEFGDLIDSDKEGTIINDGLVWEDNLVFGTKDLAFATRKAGLYLFRGRDQKTIRFRDDQICSNGKAIRKKDTGLELIDIDSPTRQVVAYPLNIEEGVLGDPRVVVDLTSDQAVPDGAILSPDHRSIIISMYNPNPAEYGETREYCLANGELLRVWQTPGSPQNTCPNLVRHEGKIVLVITTAVEHMPESRRSASPEAGSLFVADTHFDSIGDAPQFSLK